MEENGDDEGDENNNKKPNSSKVDLWMAPRVTAPMSLSCGRSA